MCFLACLVNCLFECGGCLLVCYRISFCCCVCAWSFARLIVCVRDCVLVCLLGWSAGCLFVGLPACSCMCSCVVVFV